MRHDLTGLAMAPHRSSGSTVTILLTLALALAAFAGRDQIASLASKDTAGMLGHRVSGIAVDAETGLPVAKARVTSSNGSGTFPLTREWTDETRTNARGEFTVRAAPDDESYASSIDVAAPGYLDAHGSPAVRRTDDDPAASYPSRR
jgi:hypothetical protein